MSSARYGSRPFAEQLAFFRQKINVPTAAWTDVFGAEHDAAFMVAGASKASLLQDFRAALDKAQAEGTTLAAFRKDFDQIIQRHGWAYNGGRNWRTRVIYDTNLRQAYHAGREAQMADPALRARRPYGLYRHGGSDEPRPEHLANDGMVVPLDDPWWDVWSPMNGWGCSCKKFMVSDRDVERLGLSVTRNPSIGPVETKTVGIRGPSPRTVEVPKGIDPGFAHRPGATKVSETKRAATERATAVGGQIGRDLRAEVDRRRPTDPDYYLDAGRAWAREQLGANPGPAEVASAILQAVAGGRTVKVAGRGAGVKLVREASERFPATWVAAADGLGPLRARYHSGRAYHYTHEGPARSVRLPGFGVQPAAPGAGFIQARHLPSAVHALAHRIQAAAPELDAVFQRVHRARTSGERLSPLRRIDPHRRPFRPDEVGRPDRYIDVYFGKEYGERGALEVMTMTLEALLGGNVDDLAALLTGDPNLFYTGIGLLLRWKP